MPLNAIVTGSAGNMGKAVVSRLLQDGYQVIGTSLPDENCGDNETHPRFKKYVVDVTNPQSVEKMLSYVRQHFGNISFAALLVGGFGMNKFENTSLEDLQHMFKLNFESAFVSAQAIFRLMKQQSEGGKITLVGAKPALEKGASQGMTAYSLSKSLVFRLAEHINTEGAAYNISASVIVPSILDTPPNRKAMPDADFSKWVTPEEVAGVVSFIASDASSPLRDTIYRIYGHS